MSTVLMMPSSDTFSEDIGHKKIASLAKIRPTYVQDQAEPLS